MYSIDIQVYIFEKQTKMQCFTYVVPVKKNKRSTWYKLSVYEVFLLTHQDSNLERQNQNLLCYHYTMGQTYFRTGFERQI